jgi:hypothetical protein
LLPGSHPLALTLGAACPSRATHPSLLQRRQYRNESSLALQLFRCNAWRTSDSLGRLGLPCQFALLASKPRRGSDLALGTTYLYLRETRCAVRHSPAGALTVAYQPLRTRTTALLEASCSKDLARSIACSKYRSPEALSPEALSPEALPPQALCFDGCGLMRCPCTRRAARGGVRALQRGRCQRGASHPRLDEPRANCTGTGRSATRR